MAKNDAFTLVELMIAVSILSVGIVLVLNSYLNSASIIDHTQNRFSALYILEKKMNVLEQEALEKGGLEAADRDEQIMLGQRIGRFVLNIYEIDVEGLKEELDGIEEMIKEVKMSLCWKEGNKDKDETLYAYFSSEKKE